MFPYIFAKFFWDAYDYIGRLVLVNVISGFLMLAVAMVTMGIFYPIYAALGKSLLILAAGAGFFMILALPLPFSGMIHFLSRISEDKEPETRDFMEGVRKHYWPLIKGTAVFVILFEVLAVNIGFYITTDLLTGKLKFFTMIISGLCVWIFLYLAVMMLYAYPLLVHQGYIGIKKMLVRSFLLVMDNALVTIICVILLLGIWGLGIATKGVLIMVLNFALTASLMNSMYVNVMEKYELREVTQQEKKEEGEKPASWKEIKTDEFIEDRHKRYKRSLRDILKPWEY